ncbi:MAG TPA: CHAT domain-containing protein [Blastocatellia bacterium]|nr:CHAT domain-containing protein [Blastocatellia bacterium]
MTAIHKELDRKPSNPSGIYLTRRIILAVIAVAAVAAIVTAVIVLNRDSAAERGTKALVKAYSKRRLVEPRLSGGFKAGVYNDAPDLTDVDAEQVDEAWKYILQTANSPQDIQGRLTHGRFLLASGKSSKAIRVLRLVTQNAPSNPEAHNDLGAGLLERQKVEEALDEFNLALKHDPDMPEALFNRALCYARLQLRDAARRELKRLEGIERDDGWRQEISSQLEKTATSLDPQKPKEEVVAEFRAAVSGGDFNRARDIADLYFETLREHAVLTDIIDHLRASVNNDAAAAQRAFSELELIGKLFIETNGDSEIADAALYLKGLPAAKKPEELKLNEEFAQAIDLFNTDRFKEAEAAHTRLQNEFRARGNEVHQAVSGYYSGMCQYTYNRFSPSIATLETTLTSMEGRNWPYHRGRLLALRGIAYSRSGQDSLGIKYCQQARDIFRGLGHLESLEAYSLLYLSVAYSHLGDLDKALGNIRGSAALQFRVGPESEEKIPKYLKTLSSNYLEMADIYRRRENHFLSLLFAEQAFTYAEQAKVTRYAAQASSLAALEQAQLGSFKEANENLEVALNYINEIADPRQRSFTEQLVYLRAGEVARRQSNTERSLEYYAKAEAVASQAEEKSIPMINVFRGRAATYKQVEQHEDARASLKEAVDYIERYRFSLEKGEQRSYFLDASHAVFDQLITLHQGSPELDRVGFKFTEQSRARGLLEEATDKGSGSSAPLDEIQRALPAGLALVEYSVTNEGTSIFVVGRDHFSLARSRLTIKESDDLVRDYLALLKKNSDSDDIEELSEKARTLYTNLIEPVREQLSGATAVCVVPDKALHFLPFAALIDPDGLYLIESLSISYAPSASVLVECLNEQIKKPAPVNERILAVGNPQFDTEEFSELPDLKEAAQEASALAKLYGNQSTALTGAQATKKRLLAEIKNADVIHLALHTLVKEGAPSLASLVLAGRDDGLLTLEEVYKLSLPRTRLVVMSACQSGLGHYYRGEGMVSLVRPFIVTGVPTVVASLWQVESQSSTELMIDFHRARKLSKLGAADALRQAQVKMATKGSYTHPYFWAPFIVVGSSN